MRMGKLVFNIEYVVDLDDYDSVLDAQEELYETLDDIAYDFMQFGKESLFLKTIEDPTLTKDDIGLR